MNKATSPTPSGQVRSTARNRVLAVAAGGITIAMSTVLSMIKLFEMPQGGSVTPASMLPILLYALCFGPAWGIGVGVAHGLVQFAVDPYWLTPVQMFLDYIAAFGLLGLAGFFAPGRQARLDQPHILKRLGGLPFWRVALAAAVGIAGRLAASFTAGIVFYTEYVPEGQSASAYSLIYNGSYLLPELLITIAILIAMAAIFRKSDLPSWHFLVATVFPPAGLVLGGVRMSRGDRDSVSEGRWLTVYSFLFLILWVMTVVLILLY
ncbi:MAG: energy-coupled thiamine transporter ThiT [Clostridia bacterium]|nr:energy-coupled thiamine transporter ThiT [Clostridia bacterium]